ncbi:response regulator receiver domain [Vibrio sp. 10N.247.311.51]|uniref:response regulator receiver domain n=1 Tax=Vibrio sp. 10N.247.311.51 TaxID=3229996 RepID=UPI00354EE108
MPELYKNKIVQAFRDNAIKSVLLIDDEYLPYEKLAEFYVGALHALDEKLLGVLHDVPNEVDLLRGQLTDIREVIAAADQDLMFSEVAKNFVEFFHGRQLICDVENQTLNLDSDKVRKSDLIILDYHLSKIGDNRAEKSLSLVSELSTSKHMNTVVIYTAEPLKKVWDEVASTLRGSVKVAPVDFFNDQALKVQWDNNSEQWLSEWAGITNRTIQAKFIKGDCNIELLTQELSIICEGEGYNLPNKKHVEWMLELSVRERNRNDCDLSGLKVHGNDEMWLQAGEVFVVLCEKKRLDEQSGEYRDVTPTEVWEQVRIALENWYPNFYRVVLSEVQNQIEDSNFSMAKVLGKSQHEQVALLWSILKENPTSQLKISEDLLRRVLEDVSETLICRENRAVPNFIKELANSTLHESLDFVELTNRTRNEHKAFITSAVERAKLNNLACEAEFNSEYCQNVVHALNERTTTKTDLPTYITTGTVLKSKKRGKVRWFMCVTPSCDTVPEQKNADNAAQLDPHRLLTFAKLEEVDVVEALSNAHQSSYVFISDNDVRIALTVIDPVSKQPDLVKLVIVNHNHRGLSCEGIKALKLKNQNEGVQTEELTMIPISQLESSYAARYQAVQSHHEGRIGVDFVTADFRTD